MASCSTGPCRRRRRNWARFRKRPWLIPAEWRSSSHILITPPCWYARRPLNILDVVLGLCRDPMQVDVTVTIATIAVAVAKALKLPASDKVEMYCDGNVSTDRLCCHRLERSADRSEGVATVAATDSSLCPQKSPIRSPIRFPIRSFAMVAAFELGVQPRLREASHVAQAGERRSRILQPVADHCSMPTTSTTDYLTSYRHIPIVLRLMPVLYLYFYFGIFFWEPLLLSFSGCRQKTTRFYSVKW